MVRDILGVNSTLGIKRVVKGDFIHLTANGVTVKALLKDWVLNTLNANIAF